MQSIRLARWMMAIIILLSIPFIGMQISTEVNWTTSDFVIAAIFFAIVALAYESIRHFVKPRKKRVLVYVLAFLFFALLWAEMAVGIFGSPIAGS